MKWHVDVYAVTVFLEYLCQLEGSKGCGEYVNDRITLSTW